MRRTILLAAVPILVTLVVASTLPGVAVGQGQEPPVSSDLAPNPVPRQVASSEALLAIGDELFRIDVGATTGHILLLGVEYADGYYYVTSGGEIDSTYPNYLFKIADDGSVMSSWIQSTSSAFGWRDLAWDGTYLYGSDSDLIDQIDPATGQTTGATIEAPVNPARGLAYDPATDHFWTANGNSSIYEIDRSGTVIGSFPNTLGIYGLGWDIWSAGGPYLWAFSQDGDPEVSQVTATQIDPATGAQTGVSFQGTILDFDDADLAGGVDVAPDLVDGKLVLVGMHQSTSDTIVGYELANIDLEPPPWGGIDVCVPADEAPFAYINQPWDWIEGAVAPDSTVSATLTRASSTLATASAQADGSGWFSFEFVNGEHVEIFPGDEITLSGGGLDETITVVDMQGWIDVDANSVGGILSGGAFDVWGVVCVRHPFDPLFESKEAYIDANGRFDVQFEGQVDIESDFLAQVAYPDPNGNYVVQVLYPEGLDVNVLMTDDRIEGVTTPGSTITVVVWDDSGEKGHATTVADDTGFYSTTVLDEGRVVDLVLGDHVGVSNAGHARETYLSMSHQSHFVLGANRVVGTVRGMTIPEGGTQGRVDLWSTANQEWYSRYAWVEESGEYGADFDGIVEIGPADRVRLWVSDGDGFQQAATAAWLELGANTTLDRVWGFTTADVAVSVSLYQGLADGVPEGLIGEAEVWSDATGYFSTTLSYDGSPVGITPSNVVQVANLDGFKTLFVGELSAIGNSDDDELTVRGPAGAIVHMSGFRPLPGETGSYFWDEVTIGEAGSVTVHVDSDLQDGDIYDLTAYLEQQSSVVERSITILTLDELCYLPLILR